jgi:hypothetical protein
MSLTTLIVARPTLPPGSASFGQAFVTSTGIDLEPLAISRGLMRIAV